MKNHFYYDEDTCQFIPIEYNKSEQIVYNLATWLLTGIVLTGFSIILLANNIGTPAELALKSENEALYSQLESTSQVLIELDNKLSEIAQTDNEVYRSVLGLNQISADERQAGTGGTDAYSEFDVYSSSTADLLKWTAGRVDNLERRINIQKLSFEELKESYNNNKEKLKHVPAIKPSAGVMISGWGMRDHPILLYKRMHNGMDFRADVGTPVYSTADGVIKYAGLRGNLGRIIVVDHGYGYETLYAHLSSNAEGIRKGSKVTRGDLIALSGNSGLTQGPHLHYEIHFNRKSVDPINYLFADISPEEYVTFKEIAETNTKSMD